MTLLSLCPIFRVSRHQVYYVGMGMGQLNLSYAFDAYWLEATALAKAA